MQKAKYFLEARRGTYIWICCLKKTELTKLLKLYDEVGDGIYDLYDVSCACRCEEVKPKPPEVEIEPPVEKKPPPPVEKQACDLVLPPALQWGTTPVLRVFRSDRTHRSPIASGFYPSF